MPTLYTVIDVNAPRQNVWNALVEKEQWYRWNTFLYDCAPGRPLRQGNTIPLAQRRLEGDDETEFQARILLMQPAVCLRWVSQIPGLKHEQVFELQDVGRDRVQYLHRTRFSGVAAPVFWPFIRRDEKQGLKRMAYQLKRYVEDNNRLRSPSW